MVRKNGSKNLFIKQGDNSNLDLFMQSPEFIKDFTNWEAKTSSLEVTRSRAFEKTPFDRNADEMTEYTSIEIGNNVALCADANYSTVRLGTAISGDGIYMVKTITGFPENETYENPEKLSKIETSGIVYPINTVAGESELHFDACNSSQNKRKIAWCLPKTTTSPFASNPPVSVRDSTNFPVEGAAVSLQDQWAKNLSGANSYEEGDYTIVVGDLERPRYHKFGGYSYYGCAEGEQTITIGDDPNSEKGSVADGLMYKEDGTVYFADLTSMQEGINVIDENNAYFAFPRGANGAGGQVIGTFEFTREGVFDVAGMGKIKDPEYKVEFFLSTSSAFAVDLVEEEGCGRVDIFRRRSGTLTFDGTDLDILDQDGQPAVLQSGDLIKISAALNSQTNSSSINSLNGVYFYDGDSALYYDANFSESVSLNQIRGVAKWTLLNSATDESPSSRWQWIKSIVGKNVPSEYDVVTGFDSESRDVRAVESFSDIASRAERAVHGYSDNDELKMRDKNFNLGKAIAVRKSDDAIAISQPANHFNTSSLCNVFGSKGGYSRALDNATFGGNRFPVFFVDKDHPLNMGSYLTGFREASEELIQHRVTDSIAYGFTGDIRKPNRSERLSYFNSDFTLKPLSVYRSFRDLCPDSESSETTASDDPTGVTYGEDGDFSTPMSEPVVSTDGDNVDLYDYGDPNVSDGLESFSDPDSPFSGSEPSTTLSSSIGNSNDYSSEAVSIFDFDDLAPFNYGCVFFGYSGITDDLTSIDASSGNTLIATPFYDAFQFPSLNSGPGRKQGSSFDQLHWRKAWALGKRQLDIVTSADPTSESVGPPIFFQISGLGAISDAGNRFRYDAYDMRKFRDGTLSNNWFQHPEAASGYRPAYTVCWSMYDKCTDGFGQAISFGDNGEIFIADATSHYSAPTSVLNDMLLYDYEYSEPRRDTQPQYPYYSPGDELAQDEKISTRSQANKPLQDFANAHSRSMQDVTGTEEYSYRSVYSVHIKLIRNQDDLIATANNRMFRFRNSGYQGQRVGQNTGELYVNSQILPYSAGDIALSAYLQNSAQIRTLITDVNTHESFDVLRSRYGLSVDFPFYRLSPYSTGIVLHYDSDKLHVSHVSGFASNEVFDTDAGIFKDYKHNIKIFDFSEGKTDYWLGGSNASTILSKIDSSLNITNTTTALMDTTATQFLTEVVQDPKCMIWPDAQVANLSVGHVSKTGLAGRDFSGDTTAIEAGFFGIGNLKTFSGKFRVSPFTASFANGDFTDLGSPMDYANDEDSWTYLIVVKPNHRWMSSQFGGAYDPNPYNIIVPVSDDEVQLYRSVTPGEDPTGADFLRKNELASRRKLIFSEASGLFGDKAFRYCNVSSPYYITDPWCTELEQFNDLEYFTDKFGEEQKYDYATQPINPEARDFRVDRGILVFLQNNTTDEFGLSIPESRQLVIYDTSTNNPKLIQKTTATKASSGDDYGTTRARISLTDSTTSTDIITNFTGADVCNGKIFASTANSFAIFRDTGMSQLSRSEVLGEFSEPSFPFFSFVEEFSDANPYNLNDMYQYIRNEATFTNSQVFDINNSHRSPVAFYSMKNFSKGGKAILAPVGITVTVDVDTNFTSPNQNVVLPMLAFYGSDPRLDIEQKGKISDDKLIFGDDLDTESSADKLIPKSLYSYGAQNAKNMILKRPTYRFSGGTYKGTIDIDFTEENFTSFFEYKQLSAEDNRTFRFNDGNGNCFLNELDVYGRRKTASYTFEFDDANKESFSRNFLKTNKCLCLGLLSWEAGDAGNFRNPLISARHGNRYSPYNNYKINEEEPHSFVNNARMTVVIKYKEYDIGAIRRFSCGNDVHYFEDPNVNYESSPFPLPSDLTDIVKPRTGKVVRASKSDAQPYLNESAEVLAGTDSHSIQVAAPQLAFDNPNPDFLSLAIRNIPTENNNADLSTTGHINSSGNIDLRISGVALEQGTMSIHLGEVLKNAAMNLSMPNVVGFECDGVTLALLPPTGTHVEKTSSLVFPGATGVNEGLSLSVNPTYTSGAFDFYVQGGLASGNMDIAMSGVHGIANTMPCVEGNLFIGSMTGPSSGIMPLHINRFSHSGDMTLVMEPGNSSGVMPLNIGVEPVSASGVLFTEGYEDANGLTTLYIGRQFEEKRKDLSISGPITFEGDPITLHASGAATNSVDTNDFNFDYMCHLSRTEDRFDFSQNSEMVIPETKSNSISRNTHLPGSSFRYGYYSPLNPGKRLNNFTQSSAKIFYDQELSREAVASNRNILAVGSNVSALSNEVQSLQIFEYTDGDSLELKFTYNDFLRDLVRISTISGTGGQLYIRHKSIDISDDNRIAVSVRIRNNNGLRDAVCVLQPGKFVLRSFGEPTYDLCAIEPSYTTPVSIQEVDGWVMTHAVVGDLIDESSDLLKCNNYIGNTVQWKDKDLYYDKQGKNYGSVYYIKYSDDYATENLAFAFNSTSDGQGYYSNRYNIPEGTKVGFGSKFKIDGDYAVVSAPLFDSFIANNNLSVMHAPSPEGSAYVYRFDSEWIYVDAIYSGGYTSSDISGVSDCAYNYALFGYSVDVNKDSGFVAASEPVTNKIYKYVIHGNDTVSLVKDYTDSSSAGFGNKINICANSILTSNVEAIKEPVFGHNFQFTPEETVAETNQYNPFSSTTKSVSSAFTFVLDIEPKGAKRLLVGRSFNVNFAGEPTINIEKLSILNRGNYGNLFIKGPILSTSNIDLALDRPVDTKTNDMGLQFASIGVNSGIPLHVHVPDPASGDMSLHLRQAEKFETTLFISHVFKPESGVAPLSTTGPLASTIESDAFVHGIEAENNAANLFMSAGPFAQLGFDLRLEQDDIFDLDKKSDLFIDGSTGAGDSELTTLYMGAGNFGPASGFIDFLHIQTDLKAAASGITTLSIAQDAPTGVFDGSFNTSVGGSGVSDTTGFFRENGNANLIIAATAPASGINTLYLHRKGIGGGEELDANNNLIVYNLTEASNVNLAVSGANIATADMNIAISGVVGLGTGIMPAFVRGYQD